MSYRGVMDYVNSDPTEQSNVRLGMNDAMPDMAEHEDPEEFWKLKLKKKRRQQMLKQMMVDAGYEDLAKMTNISEEHNEY